MGEDWRARGSEHRCAGAIPGTEAGSEAMWECGGGEGGRRAPQGADGLGGWAGARGGAGGGSRQVVLISSVK